jgi:hypothetical protein
MGVPFLVPTQKGSSDKAVDKHQANPVDVYFNRLGPGSRRGMCEALDAIARFLTVGTSEAKALDWAAIRYQHTSAVRGWLVKVYAPATAKRMIAALRGEAVRKMEQMCVAKQEQAERDGKAVVVQ